MSNPARDGAGAVTLGGSRVLLTGATGFVGSVLARRLVTEHDCEVHALVRRGGGDRWRVGDIEDEIAWREADLASQESLEAAIGLIDPALVFHMATYYAVDSRGVILSDMVDVNVKAGLLLVEACKKSPSLRLLVNVGTCAEFGDLREPATEDSPLDPNSVYAATKAAGVLAMRQYARDEGVPLVTLRLYNMYGPFEKPTRLVPHAVLSLLRGERVPLTAGEQAKDYTYVEDVVDAFVAAAARAGGVAGKTVNIGSGTTVSMRDLVSEIASHFDGAERLLGWGELPYRDNEMWFQGTRIDRARDVLGWEPRHSLAEGIEKTVAWYRQNRALYE